MQHKPAVEWLGSIGSTNEEAMQRGAAGASGPLWIVASEQTGGRGRNGRTWVSPEGNLYASLLLTFPRALPTVAQLALVAGLAAYDTVRKLAPDLAVRLKWPNDVLIEGAKLCGILIEGRISSGSAAHNVVVGFGLNLAHHPDLPGRRAASLAAFGVTASRQQALSCLCASFGQWQEVWADGDGIKAICSAWIDRALAAGTLVSVNTGAELIEGQFLGLDADGAMLLGLPTGSQRRITFGDVHIAAPTGADT